MSKLLALMFVCGLAVHAHAFIAGIQQSMDEANGISKRIAEFAEEKRNNQDSSSAEDESEELFKRIAESLQASFQSENNDDEKRTVGKTDSGEENAEKRDADCCWGSQEEEGTGLVKRLADSLQASLKEAEAQNPDSGEEEEKRAPDSQEEEGADLVRRIADSLQASLQDVEKQNPDSEEEEEKRELPSRPMDPFKRGLEKLVDDAKRKAEENAIESKSEDIFKRQAEAMADVISIKRSLEKRESELEKILEGAEEDANVADDQPDDIVVDADKRACRGYGKPCSGTVFKKCCGKLLCHKPHANRFGTCAMCKGFESICWKDSECCLGYTCSWFRCKPV
ncbi:uncharacterized protein LOC141910124 [Tubulanus polymorphus]|uniref:uncharacterized protein LOC141910124 n=1 Tax=Tubulanus polymorphus TaxID=672921 RepID=UPI003DA2DA97